MSNANNKKIERLPYKNSYLYFIIIYLIIIYYLRFKEKDYIIILLSSCKMEYWPGQPTVKNERYNARHLTEALLLYFHTCNS
jgi:hypothetical protein